MMKIIMIMNNEKWKMILIVMKIIMKMNVIIMNNENVVMK